MQIPYFIVPLLVGVIIQFIKIVIDFVIERKINLEYLWRSGGFPSVHSGISSSICFLVFWVNGRDSMEFAVCITFAVLFWYDAMNVRYEAGQHAKVFEHIKNRNFRFTKIWSKLSIAKRKTWSYNTRG